MALAALGLALLPSIADANTPAIYLEDSPAAQEEVERALTLREQGRVGDAAERLQQVILNHPYKLMETEAGLYEDTLSWLRRQIGGDEELLAAYRQRYSAQAERLRDQAMRPRVDPAGLERVLAGFAVTEAGLQAGMDLAALYLEQADGRSAGSVLDELADHPDLAQGEHQQRYHYLQAVAGLLAGQRDRLHEHRERLETAGSTEQVAAIGDLADRLDPPPGSLARQQPGPPRSAAVSAEQLESPLWEGQVEWTPLGSTTSDMVRRVDRSREQTVVPVQPVADERRVYLNQGDRVRALDRDSGWETWSYRWAGAGEAGSNMRGLMPMRQMRLYERGVAVAGDQVYGVMGAASPWPSRWDQGSAITALVSVDRQHGELLWEVRPASLDRAFSDAYFVGTPIAGRDRVFVLLRRSQASGFKDTFLAAISPTDGSLLWRRHIASAAVTSRFTAGPRPRMTLHDGYVFVADNFGAAAALDQRSGSVRWVRLLVDPQAVRANVGAGQAARGRVGQGGSQALGPAPVIVPAGLIVLDPNDGPPLLLDPRTGAEQRKLTDEPWTAARGLIPLGDDLLLVGATLALIDGETLEVIWQHRPPNSAPTSPDGQVAVTHEHIFYAAGDELVVLGRNDGQVQYRHATTTPANILPLEHQLVLVDEARTRSYMGWERAAERLRERIAESLTEPEPGMALAHLALRGGYSEQAIEGVDASLAALRRLRFGPDSETPAARAAQRHTFDHLLRLARSGAAAEAGIGEALFDRLATITDGPAQEVAYHLAVAAFLDSADRPTEAVDHLQAVLGDTALASQLHEDGTVSRQAGLEARRRLQDLVEVHGPVVYDAYEQRASAELRRLRARAADATALVALAEQYPLASAAPEALIAAAERMARRDELAAAAQQLRRARDWATTPELRGQIASHAAWLYERHEQPRQAIAWLDRLRREDPGVEPRRDGQPISAERWIERLQALTPDAGPLAKLDLPLAQPHVLPGRMLLLPDEAGGGLAGGLERRNVLLTLHDGTLNRYEDDSLSRRWQISAPFSDLELLGADEDQLLLWSPRAGRMFALDDATGEPAWSTDRAGDLLDEVGDAEGREAARHADHRRFMRMVEHAPHLRQQREQERWGDGDREIFTAVGSSTVALTDRQGRVVGIDRRTGRVLWRLMAPTELVTQIAVHDDRLILAGVNGPGSDAESGALSVLDLLSGELHLPLIEDRHQPRWVGFAGDQHLAVASERQLTVYRQATGEVAWRAEWDHDARVTGGWADERVLVLMDDDRIVRIYDASSGQYLSRAELARRHIARPVRSDPVEDRWYMLAIEGLRAFDAQGDVQWRDAISEPDHALLSHLLTQGHLVILARDDEGPRGRQGPMEMIIRGPDGDIVRAPAAEADHDDGAHVHLYLLDRRTGALVAEHPLGPLPDRLDANRASVQHNRLILPLAEHTLVIPGHEAD